MKSGTGILYLNDKAFKFNEGDTVNLGTVKTGDVIRIEVNPNKFTPEEGFEGKVNTNLDELSEIEDDLTYAIHNGIYTWSHELTLIEGVEVLSEPYFIGASAINDEAIHFIDFNLTI